MFEYIVSNQIRCTDCDSEPYSTHRHDLQHCECLAVAVDGGQDYLRRLGRGWEELSIVIDQGALEGLVATVDNAIESGRNPTGVVLAVLREIRDSGLVVVKHDDNGITHWGKV